MAEFSESFQRSPQRRLMLSPAPEESNNNMQSFPARMVGSARFHSGTYEVVEAESTANGQAVVVVVIACRAAAIGVGATDPRSLLGMLAVAIISWLIWVMLTLFIGTRLLP